jgi:hypothetical protein
MAQSTFPDLARRWPTANICDNAGHVPNTSDFARRWLLTGTQDGGHKTGMGNILSTVSDGVAIPTPKPIFLVMLDLYMTLAALSDVGRRLEFKIVAIETGIGDRHREFR